MGEQIRWPVCTCIGPAWTNHAICVLLAVVIFFNKPTPTEQQGCNDGFYGLNCSKNCSDRKCFDHTSDCSITGECGFGGCMSGWFTADCTRQCEGNCAKCDQQTGICIGCTNGTADIVDRCQNLCGENNCTFARSTSCLSNTGCGLSCVVGYIGISCSDSCHSQSDENCSNCTNTICEACNWEEYQRCIQNCSVDCLKTRCEQVKGPCIMSCPPGLFGARCNQVCSKTCHSSCDEQTGRCNGCKRGYAFAQCDKNCPSGCYNDSCLQYTGSCEHGCKDGFYGSMCDQQCSANCYRTQCDRDTSRCLRGCNSGWTGITCSEAERTPVMALVIAVVVLAVVLLFALLVIWYLIRYIRKGNSRRRKSHFKLSSAAGDDVVEVLERRKSAGDDLEKDVREFQKKYKKTSPPKDNVFTFDTEPKTENDQAPNGRPLQKDSKRPPSVSSDDAPTTERKPEVKMVDSEQKSDNDQMPSSAPLHEDSEKPPHNITHDPRTTERTTDVPINGGQLNTSYQCDERDYPKVVSIEDERPEATSDSSDGKPDIVIIESTKL